MKKVMAVMMVLTTLSAGNILANDMKMDKRMKMMMDMTPEQRQSMATTHEKLATCLRSTRTMTECHDEMMTNCEAAMGKEACSMMQMKQHDGKMNKKSK